jgi:IMP dehydrogenase
MLQNLQLGLTLDEISLIPSDLSIVRSRADVDPTVTLFGDSILPVLSSNMTSVYSPQLSREIIQNGALSIVHRFCSIENNIKLFQDGCLNSHKPWVSIGSSVEEIERSEALVNAGAEVVVIDLAMGNSLNAVEQFKRLREKFSNNIGIIVSDFSTSSQLRSFNENCSAFFPADGFTIGQGSGSFCKTRAVTGIGVPTATMIDDCSYYAQSTGQYLILNGGIKQSQDLCKAIALGCDAVIVGRLFAACLESGAENWRNDCTYLKLNDSWANGLITLDDIKYCTHKSYKGSASQSSYNEQGKNSTWRTSEGDEGKIKITGKVKDLIQKFEGGLRSSMSYLNAYTIQEYKENASFIQITGLGAKEAQSFGRDEK